MIFYHIHLIENTWFLDDLFCKTKVLRALQSGPDRGVAYTQLKIQLLIVVYFFLENTIEARLPYVSIKVLKYFIREVEYLEPL